MDACNFTLEDEIDTTYGSFFQRLWFRSGEKLAQEEFDRIFLEGQETLRQTYLNDPGAVVSDKLAEVAAKLIAALERFDRGVIRLGNLLVAKIIREGVASLVVEALSPDLTRPLILKNDTLSQQRLEN